MLGWIEQPPPAGASRPAAQPRSPACSPGSTAASCRPAPPARRPAAVPTCCRPGAISIRSTPAPCRPRRPGSSAGSPPALLRRALRPGPRRLPARLGAVGLGHLQHAHRRRRHRPGAGADRASARHGSRRAAGSPASRSCRSSVLGRPRVDVTLRISGFFRDAFPGQIELFDSAVRAVAALDEPRRRQPARRPRRRRPARARSRRAGADDAARRAGYRVFGSKPGAYGAGLQAPDRRGRLGDRRRSRRRLSRLGRLRLRRRRRGRAPSATRFEPRLAAAEAVVHNQDNREHDLLDTDDYYQFEGGLAAAVEHLLGARAGGLPQRSFPPRAPAHPHAAGGDRPGRARPRRQSEMDRRRDAPRLQGRLRDRRDGRLHVRLRRHHRRRRRPRISTRSTRPISPTPRCATSSRENNPAALAEIAARFREAIERGLWRRGRNCARGASRRARGARA